MKKIILLIILNSAFVIFNSSFGDSWVQKADFGGTARRGAAIFSINNKGYIGIGTDVYPNYNFRNDFWEYDASSDIWTQKANFPGAARYNPICFSIGTKGYLGGGWNGTYFNDFWQYDQLTNIWAQKGNFPGANREEGISFTINNKWYAGFGLSSSILLNDLYSYNDTADTWTQLASCPGAARCGSFGFGINGKGYVGAGMISYPNYSFANDVWQYDPFLNNWTQKANFPGLPRSAMGYFQINNKGYAGGGYIVAVGNSFTFYKDFFEYDPALNIWIQKSDMPRSGSYDGGFSLNNLGYAGTGYDSTLNLSDNFWEYTPDSTTSVSDLGITNSNFTFYPNPFSNEINITHNNKAVINKTIISLCDMTGKEILSKQLLGAESKLQTVNLEKGIYFVAVSNGKEKKVKKLIKE